MLSWAHQTQPWPRLRSTEVEVNLRPAVSRPVCPSVRRPSETRDQFFFLLEISFKQLRLCYFVTPSLTRGRVVIYLYNCSRSPYLYPPGTGWPSYTHGHWVLFLSPLTTRRNYGGDILARLHTDSGPVVRLPGFTTEMHCVSCAVRTEFIYVM
jgi:hypothetical protein